VTCREFADFMADYLGNELGVEVRTSFEHHLKICANCRKYLDGYAATIELGRRAFDDLDAAVPSDVPEELVRAILDARNRR
jgi:predicted anti-sigma-YlaC factor YlaD